MIVIVVCVGTKVKILSNLNINCLNNHNYPQLNKQNKMKQPNNSSFTKGLIVYLLISKAMIVIIMGFAYLVSVLIC